MARGVSAGGEDVGVEHPGLEDADLVVGEWSVGVCGVGGTRLDVPFQWEFL